MKKVTLALAMAALVIFAGCKKDKEITGTTLKASIEQYKSGDSKTSIVPVDATTAEIRWTAGDKIVVNNGTTSGTFTLTGGASSKTGTFNYNGEYTFGDNNFAVYPETAIIEGNTVTVSLPAELDFDANKNGANPMLGTFNDPEALTFTSLCGALGISLKAKSADVAITAIEVVSKTDEKLNGTFTVDATATGDDLKLVKSGTDGTNSVRFNCDITLTSTEAQNFYFAMPMGTLASGFTLNVYGDGADPIFTKETANDIAIVLNQVNQMPTLEVVLPNVVDLSTLTANYEAQDGDILINTLAGNYKISVNTDNATITLRGATINGNNNISIKWAGITCQNNTTIILEGTNTVKGFYEDYPGIHIAENKTLTIQGSGSLTASSNGFGAGIGGGYKIHCGNIIINGGTINATGGDGNATSWGAAGIGSGSLSSCGFISINNINGTVEAFGGRHGAAGIGSGMRGFCGNITIDEGTVTAIGGEKGAGIGSGEVSHALPPQYNYCGEITINGGTVTATGGIRGTGIGTGFVYYGQRPICSGINITGGNVEARGGDFGAGIGVGAVTQVGQGDCGGISISSGSVTTIGGVGAAGIGTGIVYSDDGCISTCGDISITGGTVIATGGAENDTYQGGAGIGTGYRSSCGAITIDNTVTSVTATKGSGAENSIGKNHSDNPGTCGTITIGGTVTGNISISPYTYP